MLKYILSLLLLMPGLGCSGHDLETPGETPGKTPQEDSQTPPQEIYVSSAADVKALGTLPAGSVVVWRNGLYSGEVVELKAAGTAEAPVVLRAESAGKVIFTGTSRISVSGSHASVEGFWWRNPEPVSGKAVVTMAKGSDACALRDCAITGDNTVESKTVDTKWVSLYGTNHRVESCTLHDKRNIGTLLVVWLETGVVPAHTIAGNSFTRPVTLVDDAGKAINGQETIRIGTSDFSMQDAGCIVEDNYFYHCHGEQAEIVSNKSCRNIYRRNLFVESQGSLTLRHGNDCTVTGCYFIGNGLEGTGGVRIIGENHTVESNWFESLAGTGYRSAICIVRGQENAALNGYWQVKNAVVRRNYVFDCKYGLNVNYASSTSNQVLPVKSTVIENNTVSTTASSSYAVYLPDAPAEPEITWRNNTLYGRQRGITLPAAASAPARPDVKSAIEAIRNAAGCSWITN